VEYSNRFVVYTPPRIEAESLDDIESDKISSKADTLLACDSSNQYVDSRDKIIPDVKKQLDLADNFHSQPIVIRNRSAPESFTEDPSPTQSIQSQMRSTQEVDSVRKLSTGDASLSMWLYDDISEDSEYWSTEDISEDEDGSETTEEKTRAQVVDFLVSEWQFLHLSVDHRTCANDGATEDGSGVVHKEVPKANSLSSQGKKRVREGDQHHEEDDEDQKRRKASEQVGNPRFRGRSSRFACPFFQRTPEQYQNEVCTGPGFRDMKSLKYFFPIFDVCT
jgi:hypothetical protein